MALRPLTDTVAINPSGNHPIPLDERQKEENDRLSAVREYETRRRYYDGTQYEDENNRLADTAGYRAKNLRLPEHLRKHAYSSHIGEAIDTLADMLSDGLRFEGEHAELLNQWWDDSAMSERVDDFLREALMLGDVYARPEFNVATETMEIDIWEAESIWPVYNEDNWRQLDRISIHRDLERDGLLQHEQRLFRMELFIDDNQEQPVFQLVEYVIIDGDVQDIVPHALPFFDLVHARGDSRHRLRSSFGDSLVTKKVRGTADRYNAMAQLGYRIARQNSYSTLAVVGDSSTLSQGKRDDSVPKDVADVLTFPGGTQVHSLELSSDPKMIESQLSTLERNLYREFGLSKNDIDEFSGMGTISGYALEVLNRRDRATHDRIRKHARESIRGIANTMLDIHAIRTAELRGANWWDVDPEQVYPNREGIDIVIGSGDIIDTVSDRDDFQADVLSRREVLRRRGYSEGEINNIEKEIDEEKQMDARAEPASLQQSQATTEDELPSGSTNRMA